MRRKASPIVLLHKSEVTYRDTGVSKKYKEFCQFWLILPIKIKMLYS